MIIEKPALIENDEKKNFLFVQAFIDGNIPLLPKYKKQFSELFEINEIDVEAQSKIIKDKREQARNAQKSSSSSAQPKATAKSKAKAKAKGRSRSIPPIQRPVATDLIVKKIIEETGGLTTAKRGRPPKERDVLGNIIH